MKAIFLTVQVPLDYIYQINLIVDYFNNQSKSNFIFTCIELKSKHLQKT